MEFKVYAQGDSFAEEKLDLQISIDLLTQYQIIFSEGINLAGKRLDRPPTEYPRLYIQRLDSGSLEAIIMAVAAGTITTIPPTPEVARVAWDLIKEAYQAVRFCVGVFNRTGAPPTINVQGDVNVFNIDGDNNTININSDTIGLARKHHKKFHAMASSIQPGRVDEIELSAEGDSERLYFNPSNHHDFKVSKTTRQDQQPIEFGVNVFSFNKTGRLETVVSEEEDPKPFGFELIGDDEMVERCIEALKAGHSQISAQREYEVNALGEAKITKFSIHSVLPGNQI